MMSIISPPSSIWVRNKPMYQTHPQNNFDAVGDFVSTDGMTVREKVDHKLKTIEDQLSEIEEIWAFCNISNSVVSKIK